MTDAIAKLGLDLETTGLERGAAAADRVAASMDRAEREAGQLEHQTKKAGQQLSALQGIASNLAAQLGAAFSIWAVIRANDAWISATNSLRLVTDTATELRDITQEVFDLSQRTAQRFEGMSGLYASIQRAAGDAIGSQREVLRLTETIAKLTAASGGAESSRNAALFQLRQAMQGAVVQAQEFNSLVDGAPLLVQAIADSLGVTRGELRTMVLEQRLATRDMIAALQDYADEADAIFARVNFTFGDAMVRLQNAFQQLVGTNLGPVFSQIINAISFVANHLDALIPVLSGVAVGFAIAFAPTAISAMGAAVATLFNLLRAHPMVALISGIVAAGVAMYQFGDQVVLAQARVADFRKNVGDDLEQTAEQAKRVVDVTLRDFADASLQIAGEAIGQMIAAVGAFGAELVTEFTKATTTTDQFWTGLLDAGKAVLNFIIGAFKTMWDSAALSIPRIGDLIKVTFIGAANEAIGSVERIMNVLQDMAGPLGLLLPDIQLPRLDQPAAEMERLAAAANDFGAAVRENFSTDFVGGAIDEIMARASAIAVARDANAAAAADAAAAAAAAAAAGGEALTKQVRARQALFDELEAQLALNEREFAIYQETEELLRQFPDYYRSIAAGAEDVAEAAREAAEQDARRLDTLRRQIAAQNSLKQLAQETARQNRLIDAASIGADELDLTQRTLDLLEEHAELYESMGKSAEDIARAEAERQIRNERILERMTEQAERAREIARAPIENFQEGLQSAADDFWTNFAERGFDAFDDLGDQLKSVLRRLQADILRAIFDPITQGLTNAISQAMGGVSGGGGFDLGGMISQIFGGSSGGKGGQGGSILDIIFNRGGIAGQGAKGGAAGGGMMDMLGQIGASYAMADLGSQLANALGLVQKEKGGAVGGTIGGIAGSLIGGPIGGAIGSFIGSTIGGLFGPGPSANAAGLGLDASGNMTTRYGSKSTDETRGAVDAVAERVRLGMAAIEELDGTMASYISRLNISARRDRSSYELTNKATGQKGPWVGTGTIADPNDLANDALKGLLGQTTFENPVLEAVRDAMMGSNKSFEDIIKTLGELNQILPATETQTSAWKQALDKINETFDEVIESAGGAAAALNAARADAVAALRGQFADSIEDAILSIESPLTLQFEELLKTQSQRLADAAAMGADVSRVMHLNELELKSFIEQAGGSAEAFASLNAIFEELIAKAAAAGNATQPLLDAYAQARAGVVSAFDDDVAQQMANLTNPTLGALKSLLDAQKSRLEQARAIGANIIAVERLNALEQKAFFENLSDEQRAQLAAHLGLIEDFTGRIGVVLSQLNDELNQRINDVDQMRSDLLQNADALRGLAENLANQRQGIVDRYGAMTPMAGVEALRERLTDLADQARGGNESALNALGQVGQQLIDASRALYGSTTTFRGDYDLVTQILAEAEQIAAGRADELESQAETLIAQRDLLIEIRDILADPDPSMDVLQQRLGQLDANQDVVANLLRQYLQLSAQQAGQQIDLGDLYQASSNAAQTPALGVGTSTPTLTPTGNASNGGATPSTVTNTGTTGSSPADGATAQMIAVQIDVLQQGFAQLSEDQQEVRRELRQINQRGYLTQDTYQL